jgi:hypothetical protein
MPLHVSYAIRRNSLGAAALSLSSGDAPGIARMSSTSSDACQKKRYGLMVVPKTATIIVAASASRLKLGQKVRSTTSPQGT